MKTSTDGNYVWKITIQGLKLKIHFRTITENLPEISIKESPDFNNIQIMYIYYVYFTDIVTIHIQTFYSHRNFQKPQLQPHPHSSFEDEVCLTTIVFRGPITKYYGVTLNTLYIHACRYACTF